MPPSKKTRKIAQNIGASRDDFHTEAPEVFRAQRGLNKKIVQQISERKKEPAWMKNFRLSAYARYREKKLPLWGADVSTLDFNSITYYVQSQDRPPNKWKDVPKSIKETF